MAVEGMEKGGEAMAVEGGVKGAETEEVTFGSGRRVVPCTPGCDMVRAPPHPCTMQIRRSGKCCTSLGRVPMLVQVSQALHPLHVAATSEVEWTLTICVLREVAHGALDADRARETWRGTLHMSALGASQT